MAKLVEIIGVTHSPVLAHQFEVDPDFEPGIRGALENFHLMRQKMTDAKADVLLVVGCDHLNQWFMDNMPAFLIGKAPVAEGPFPHETGHWKLRYYRADVDVPMARGLVADGFDKGVDFAFSEEFLIDHSFTMPLSYIRPEMDLPIVPIFANVMAPPIPSSRRFYEVGAAIRDIIEELPSNQRVGAIVSGHMAVEIGAPRAQSGSTDPEFDHRMMELLARGDAESVIREATVERMLQAGTAATGFANYLLMLGLARGLGAPTYAEANYTKTRATAPFVAWDNP